MGSRSLSDKAGSESDSAQATPSAPIPSGTVLLLRDGSEGLEVFMVVRHHQIDFASGALVFPGGKADPQDFDDDLLPYLTGAHADPAMRAIQVSTIREAFEECGVLIARSRAQAKDAELISADRLAKLQDDREPMNAGTLTLLDFLEREDLTLACDQLHHFAHWITPTMMPKRFDTHFYLVVAPPNQIALHDGYESVDSVWITPQQAIEDAKSGRRTVIFPTLRNIEKLAQSHTTAQAIEAAQRDAIVPVLPWTEQRDDGNYICIPTDAGYAHCEEKMPAR